MVIVSFAISFTVSSQSMIKGFLSNGVEGKEVMNEAGEGAVVAPCLHKGKEEQSL